MRNPRQTIWYVVADATRARVVKLQDGPVRPIGGAGPTIEPALNEELVGPNLKSRDILADRLGQRAPGYLAAPVDPRDDAKAGFRAAARSHTR
jgi:hypothetical protein